MMSDSASSVNNLRQYRFKKEGVPNTPTTAPDTQLKLAPGRKRIHTTADSSSDDAQSPAADAKELTVKEKETRLVAVRTAEPDYDTMVCQDALFHNNWEVEAAIKHLKEKCVKKRRIEPIRLPIQSSTTATTTTTSVPTNTVASAVTTATPTPATVAPATTIIIIDDTTTTTTTVKPNATATPKPTVPAKPTAPPKPANNGVTVPVNAQNGYSNTQVQKKTKKKHESDNSNDDDNDHNARPTERVYNSDDEDSDFEQHVELYEVTKDRKDVLDFMNTADEQEFLSVRMCSTRKVDIILELRPFSTWQDLVQKIQGHRFMSTEILNGCQEFLTKRNNMVKIMKKCTRMVERLEAAVARGAANVCNQPANLNPDYKLADYQLIGLNWLTIMNAEGMNGILADEMGLGKTIQVIAFLAYLKEANLVRGTHLIVVPSSTLENWSQEFIRWCPSIVVEKYYGAAEERKALRIKYAKGGLDGIDVLLTTYHTVGSAPEERKMFRVTQMHYVIFDEAHMLKNMTTLRYTNLFRINSERRLLLTGTPLQNNLLELMSLLCFVMPSMFADNTEDIKSLFRKTRNMRSEEDVNSFEQMQIERAKRIMKPFVLRRLKKDVLNSLPPKTDYTHKVPLASKQKEMYSELVKSHSSESGIVRASNEQNGASIMMEMRKLANHPLLMRFFYSDDMVHEIAKRLSTHSMYKKNPNPQYIFEELAILSDFQLYQTLERYHIKGMNIPDHLILDSGKFQKLDEMLPKLKAEGHRVLIFSQFTMMLDVLERYLDIREYGFLRLDGQTAVTDRQDLIDQYMGDPELFVFLLSTRAGGLGINLTAADTVIIHDIDFNPYNDKQAEDRCHRMGQKKPVTIHRLLGEGTIEEGMSVVAQNKLELEKEVTNESGKDVKEHKCMIRILTMALGINENRTEKMLSPEALKASIENDEEKIKYDNDE